jgi:hypothetical protein
MPRLIQRSFLLIGLLASLLILPGTARADISPPRALPGSDIGPGGQTQVRMLAEQIVIDVQSEPGATPSMYATVSGRFTMRNLGDADEQLQVRFPQGDPRGASDDRGKYPQVQLFAATVDGQPVATTLQAEPNPQGATSPPLGWLTFPVDFPVGQDVTVAVSYQIDPTMYAQESFGTFAYVLQTGAGWRDSIGSATVSVRLPYPATAETVRPESTTAKTTPGATFDGNEVRWSFSDLEPTAQNDIFVTVMVPTIWKGIADARAALAGRPDNAAALSQLSRAYEAGVYYDKLWVFDEKTDPFYVGSEQAAAQALELSPGSAQLHADYAALIARHHLTTQAAYDVLKDDARFQAYLQQAMGEISQALALDPQQKTALDTLADMQSNSDAALILPTVSSAGPTAVPTPTDAPPPTATPPPTAAPAATTAPVPTPSPPPAGPAGAGGWPLFGGGIVVGMALSGGAFALLGGWRSRRGRAGD